MLESTDVEPAAFRSGIWLSDWPLRRNRIFRRDALFSLNFQTSVPQARKTPSCREDQIDGLDHYTPSQLDQFFPPSHTQSNRKSPQPRKVTPETRQPF